MVRIGSDYITNIKISNITILKIRGLAQVEQHAKMIWTCAEDSEYTGQKMLKMEMTSVRHIINSSQGMCAPLSWFMMTASSLIPCSLTSVLKWSSTAGPASTVRPKEDRFSLVFYNTDCSYSVKTGRKQKGSVRISRFKVHKISVRTTNFYVFIILYWKALNSSKLKG